MSSVHPLREFISARLTAAAEEIFREFQKTIVQYEEEIDRQRRLLDITWRPAGDVHAADISLQSTCKDEDLSDQQRNSDLDQEEPELLHIKEEQEELSTSLEEEQLVLKQEAETFAVTPADESVTGQLFSHSLPVAESQDQEGSESGKCDGWEEALRQELQMQHHPAVQTPEKPYSCKTCGKTFPGLSTLARHMATHTGFSRSGNLLCHHRSCNKCTCKICGKILSNSYHLKAHMRIHTGEKPYPCNTCGRRFSDSSACKKHETIHTGEKPYSCGTCGKRFRQSSNLTVHMRTHSGEKPFSCSLCQKSFAWHKSLVDHMKIHTGEKPDQNQESKPSQQKPEPLQVPEEQGDEFRVTHKRTYSCETCPKTFAWHSSLVDHMRSHTSEKPYSCKICGKGLCSNQSLRSHIASHTDGKLTQENKTYITVNHNL